MKWGIYMSLLDIIKTRRSIRKYLNKDVEQEKLEQILLAGQYAPSGGNSQTNHFIVIKNKEILNKLVLLVQDEFSKMEFVEGMYKSLKSSIMQSKKGNYCFHYNAPILIVVANKKEYGNAMADASCALENMMLMARDLELGSCWINQLRWLNENKNIVSFMNELGLKEDEVICGSLSLGYFDGDINNVRLLERKGNPITYVE